MLDNTLYFTIIGAVLLGFVYLYGKLDASRKMLTAKAPATLSDAYKDL
jgi:hypothetical protein